MPFTRSTTMLSPSSISFRPLMALALFCVGSASVSACWVPNETGQAMQRDIRNLRRDVDDTRRGVDEARAQLQEQLSRADASVAEVDSKLQELNRAARKTDAGFGVRLDELQRELQELRGQNELLLYKLTQQEKQTEELKALAARLDAVEKGIPAATSSSPAPSSSASSSSTPTPAAVPTDKAGLLAHGKKLFKENKLEETRGVMRRVIEQWPKELDVADDAAFHIAETYFKENEYRRALQEYIQIVEKFAKGNFVDDAYYRIGLCSIELGNLEDALIFFDEIIKNHKKSPLLKAAKKKHAEVSKRLEKEKKRG